MKVIIACDFASQAQLKQFLTHFPRTPLLLKVGWELLLSTSLNLISTLKQQGHRIMLDLKLHDIPTTVTKTLRVIQSYQPDWVTINLGAGVASVRAAAKFCATTSIKLVGVSYLTSMSTAAVQQVNNNHQALADNFTHLVRCGLMWGVNHFVCAGAEASLVKKIQPLAHTFCPGVTTLRNDQVRTTDAVHTAMIDYLIVGRQITTDVNPARVYHKITRDGKLN